MIVVLFYQCLVYLGMNAWYNKPYILYQDEWSQTKDLMFFTKPKGNLFSEIVNKNYY